MGKEEALYLVQDALYSVRDSLRESPQVVNMETRLVENLNLDSLGLLNFIVALEEKLDLEFDVDVQMEIIQGNVGDIVEIISRYLK